MTEASPNRSGVPILAQIGLVWDNHACMPLRPDDLRFLPALERVRAAGVNVITLNLAFGRQSGASARAMARAFTAWIAAHDETLMLVRSAADALQAKASGRLGICFDLEGMDALDGNIDNVALFYELGARWMLAAYNLPNAAGGGCLASDDGLTSFGRDAVREMNRVGMTVCASHCGYRTARELIDLSAFPVIFSHSNPRACWDHPRNLPDDLMRVCAARGGVVGINGFGPFLGANDARITTLVDHVEYALDLIGDDHVGLALDYVFDRDELDTYIASNPDSFPSELYTTGAEMIAPWEIKAIAEEMRRRGHGTLALNKILGGNHLRIARSNWK